MEPAIPLPVCPAKHRAEFCGRQIPCSTEVQAEGVGLAQLARIKELIADPFASNIIVAIRGQSPKSRVAVGQNAIIQRVRVWRKVWVIEAGDYCRVRAVRSVQVNDLVAGVAIGEDPMLLVAWRCPCQKLGWINQGAIHPAKAGFLHDNISPRR